MKHSVQVLIRKTTPTVKRFGNVYVHAEGFYRPAECRRLHLTDIRWFGTVSVVTDVHAYLKALNRCEIVPTACWYSDDGKRWSRCGNETIKRYA